MPSIQKRGDAFRIVVSMGYDMAGRQIRKTTTYKPSPNTPPLKAEKLATAFAYEFEIRCRGLANMNENMRFAELSEWYFSEIAPHRLKETTLRCNRRFIELYVLPYIGRLRLREIGAMRIDELFSRLYTEGRCRGSYRLSNPALLPPGTGRVAAADAGVDVNTLRAAAQGRSVSESTADKISAAAGVPREKIFAPVGDGKGLSAGTVARVRTALSPIFAAAVRKEMLARNPVANATSPRGEKRERPFLDLQQCRALVLLLSKLPNPQAARAVEALLYTGLRVGELTALRWDDVDFPAAQITVRHSLCRLDGEYLLTSPKTASSARTVPLTARLIELFAEQKADQSRLISEAGDTWLPRNAVFTGRRGEFMSRGYLNLAFKRLLAANDFPPLHIHDLRHANASLLINMGVSSKVVSEHLGHASTQTTENIYAHVFNQTRERASQAIGRALEGV